MQVRKVSAAIVGGAILCALLVPAYAAEPPKPEPEITEKNWEQHPTIVEIRKLYNDIQSQLEHKKLKYQKKSFAKLPRACRGMYPTEYLAIATDRANRVRLDVTAQRISDDDLLTTRNYYDEDGRLRFVYRTDESSEGFATIHYRMYLTDQGKIFWDVKTEGKHVEFGEMTRSREMMNLTTAGLLDGFMRIKVECDPEDAEPPREPVRH